MKTLYMIRNPPTVNPSGRYEPRWVGPMYPNSGSLVYIDREELICDTSINYWYDGFFYGRKRIVELECR